MPPDLTPADNKATHVGPVWSGRLSVEEEIARSNRVRGTRLR